MDMDLDRCWKQSLDYYTQRLAQSISGYAGTLLFIQQWHHQHGGKQKDFEQKQLDRYEN